MTSFYIYNSQDDSYIDISAGLDMPWIELTEEAYGDAYTYPAIYNLTTHQVLQPVEGEDSWGTYSLVSVAPDSETETLETSFNFDFKDAFSDENIDIDASFSTASDTSTWIYGNTARLTDRQYNDPDPSTLRFSEREKTIEEGDSFAVLNDDGEIWYCKIEESASRGHGDRFDGVTVSYFSTEQGELTDDYGDSISDAGIINIDSTISGDIETEGDYDLFAIELISGFEYEFTAKGTADGDSLHDPYLALFGGDGQAITSNDDDNDSFDSLITFEASTSGTHYLEVSENGDDMTGSYLLSATFLGEDEVSNDLLDSNNDGFVDGITNYQMWTASGGVDLMNRRGRTYSEDTSRMWDAIKAVETSSGFSVLVEGQRNKEGQFKVATANDEGVVGGASRWQNGNQMFNEGYEDLFAMDFNGNNQIGF